MKLSAILSEIEYKGAFTECEVTGITDNSDRVKPGFIFVCINGKHFDGHTKAAEVLGKGAAAVVAERDLGLEGQILVADSRRAYALMSAAYFSHPEKNLKIIGITGTNGKTTTAFILRSALEKLGHKTGMIGTVKVVVGDREFPASLTTPDPFTLFGLLAMMCADSCEYCVMETSSQALDQHRVDGIHFTAAIFTNLTVDHLDYHETIEKYKKAKHLLFENTDLGVYNIDDEAGEYMMENTACRKVTYSLDRDDCNYSAKNIRFDASGVKYEIVSNDDIGRVSFKVPGRFNVYNSMGAVVCLLELGMNFKDTLEAVSEFPGVPGRMEVVPTGKPYAVIIDYAHTPDGLQNVLSSVKEVARGRVIAVFGCGGDRDKTKRPIMGKIGSELADIAIITSDNPRTEDPEEIINEILAGVGKHSHAKIIVECDRTKAIKKALSVAEEGDVIVLAGKGHETYQILASGKIHYDEREIVAELLK